MKTVNIHEAKPQLSRLIAEVVAGDEVVIAKAGKPLVRLVAMAALDGPRPLGQHTGRVVEANNCWDQDPEIDALFYGSQLEPTPVRRVAEPKVKRPGRRAR